MPGRRPAPSTRASSSSGLNRRRAGRGPGRGGVAVLEQGQRLDRVAAEGAGEDGARAVRRWRRSPGRPGAAPGDLAEGGRGVVDDLEHGVAERQVEAVAGPGAVAQDLVQQVAVALDAADALAHAGGLGAALERGQGVGAGVDDGDVVARAGPAGRRTCRCRRRRRGRAAACPPPTTGSSAAQTAAVRAGSCSGAARLGSIGTRPEPNRG